MTQLATLHIDKHAHKFSAAHFTIFSESDRERPHALNYGVPARIVAEMEVFKVGQRVEARFGEDVYYYPGLITKCNDGTKGNNTYNVKYNDGSEEADVPEEYIRPISMLMM